MRISILLILLSVALWSCDSPCRFNTDKYEMRTGVNIPELKGGDCNYIVTKRYNLSVFEIDTLALESSFYKDLDGYISEHGFEQSHEPIKFEGEASIPLKYEGLFSTEEAYVKKDSEESKWILILDRKSGIMVGQIKE